MQLSRGLDLHNSLQNSDSKLTAKIRCETQYPLRTKGAKKKCVRQELFSIIFNLLKCGCVFLNKCHFKKGRGINFLTTRIAT